MDANNLLVNMVSNNLQISGKQNTKTSNEQNSFLNLLNIVMQNKIDTNKIPEMDLSTSNNDIINMLKGNLNEQLSIIDSNISNVDITNLLQTDNKDDKSTSSTEIDYNNIMSMLSGITQNISYPDIQKLTTKDEDTIYNLVQGIQQNTNLENLVLNSNKGSNGKNVQEFLNSTIQMNNPVKNNFVVEKGTENNKQNNELYQALTTGEKQNVSRNINSKANSLEEVLLTEVNKRKENFNEEIYISRGIVEDKNAILDNNNKIIEVNDESSQIKTTVLSQIEDKIVVMTNEKEETQQVLMELFPKNLGKVNIKMSMDAEKITVEIASLNEETGRILMSNIKELASALQNTINRDINISVTSNKLIQAEQSNLNYSNQQSGLNYSNQQSSKERNSSSYTFDNDLDVSADDSNITEMMNLRNLKLNRVV